MLDGESNILRQHFNQKDHKTAHQLCSSMYMSSDDKIIPFLGIMLLISAESLFPQSEEWTV